MAYADLLEQEGIRSNYLCVLKPRRYATGFSVFSGNVYSVAWDYGYVTNLAEDGTELTAGSSSSLSAGEYWYDPENQVLYVHTTGSVNPSSVTLVATFEVYAATFDAHFQRIPTSAESTTNVVVYWEPIITKAPVLKQDNTNIFDGFLPEQSTEITLNNAEHIFERLIYDSSFNRARIDVYHWLDTLETGNIKKVLEGVMAQVSYSQATVNIKVFEKFRLFDREIRSSTEPFYETANYSSLDPNFIGQPTRIIYGLNDGVQCVNVSYVRDNPTTSDNRVWCVGSGQTGLVNRVATVLASPAPTSTRAYVDDATGFSTGDHLHMALGTGSEYLVCTDVNYASDYIDYQPASGTVAAGDTIERRYVSAVYIKQGQRTYRAYAPRDYDVTTLGVDTFGISFTGSVESSLGLNTLSPSDKVTCKVYGKQNNVTLGGSSFGGNESKSGILRNSGVILWDILKTAGVEESDLDSASFQAIETLNEPANIVLPEQVTGEPPTLRTVLLQFLRHLLCSFYVTNDRTFKIEQVDTFTGTADKTLEDDEIIENSIGYTFSYADIVSQVALDYNFQEIPFDAQNETDKTNYDRILKTSTVAEYLHDVEKLQSFKSLHGQLDVTEAGVLADRLLAIFSERSGRLSFTVKNRFFDTLINDEIDVTRNKMPGFEYDVDSLRTRTIKVRSVQRSLQGVNITGDDQKGIEDNSGDF